MENFMDLRRFFEEIKNVSFWQRLFSWKNIRVLSYAAYEDFAKLMDQATTRQSDNEKIRHERDLLAQDKTSILKQLADARDGFLKIETRMQHLDQDLKRIQSENQELHRKVLVADQKDEQRRREHDQNMQRFMTMQAGVEKKEAAIREKQLREVEEKNELMKETWKRHEEWVEKTIKSICDRNAIEYVDNVPFKGKPDNVVKICDELVIFDAKSPASTEDLSNFNAYLRNQAEALSKYASHENVRKDLYFVVPSNTIDDVKKRSFHLGNFNVFVITPDALEPVIAGLKQLESYEFAEQLSPEDRQSICRIVGSYIYMTKRRIQIDQDFNGHALDLLSKTQREIPGVMQEQIANHEKAMKLNPPVDKRTKTICMESLEKTQAQLKGQAKAFQVVEEIGLLVNG